MEHRQSLRLSTNAHLRVYSHGKRIGVGHLREVNRNGLFVATDSTEASPNQVLELELTSDDPSSSASLRVKVMVVHKTDQGLGVILLEDQHQAGIPELYSWLLRKHRNSQCRAAQLTPQSNTGSYRNANT